MRVPERRSLLPDLPSIPRPLSKQLQVAQRLDLSIGRQSQRKLPEHALFDKASPRLVRAGHMRLLVRDRRSQRDYAHEITAPRHACVRAVQVDEDHRAIRLLHERAASTRHRDEHLRCATSFDGNDRHRRLMDRRKQRDCSGQQRRR
jgi:hypothetical protein